MPAHIVVDFVTETAPVLDRAVELESFRVLNRTIERHPGHYLGIGEMLPRPAHLPDTFIRLAPDSLEILQQRLLQRPACRIRRDPATPALVQGVHDLAVDVELKLI